MSPTADPGLVAGEVEAGGLSFRTFTAGQGERLVLLLHGFPSTSAMWEPVIDHLRSEDRTVIAFDQRGYSPGARPTEVEAYGRQQLVGDVVAVADALGFDRFDVIGHDWGGAVAWGIAATHPDRVRSVASVSTPHPDALVEAFGLPSGDQAQRSSYMQLFSSEVGKAEAELLDASHGGLEAQHRRWGMDDFQSDTAGRVRRQTEALSEPGALTGALNWYRRGFEWAGLGPVEVPALYVWPTEDAALGREAAELTRNYVTGPYRFVELDGISHWAVEQDPARVGLELSEHLAALRD